MHTSLRELAGEGLTELLDVDGRLLRTLRALLLHPGRLTTEYLAGRRTRYVRPVRLYLTLSVLYFVALSLKSGGMPAAGAPATPAGASTAATAAPLPAASPDARTAIRLGAPELADTTGDGAAERLVKRRLLRLAEMPEQERQRAIMDGLVAHLPKAFFVLVPLFAALLQLLHRGRGVYYAEHLILALHVHAFAFVLFTARELAGAGPAIDLLVTAWLLPYIALALRRTYGQSWVRTTVKTVLLVPAYSVLVTVALLLVTLVTLALL